MKIFIVMGVGALTLAGILLSTGCSEENHLPANKQIKETTLPTPNRTAYIDPKTGKLTSKPSDEDAHAVLQQNVTIPKELPAVEMITHPDGTVQARTHGRFNKPLVATIDCDGQVITQHSDTVPSQEPPCEDE